MQAFLKVKKNIAGRNDKKVVLQSAKTGQSNPVVQNAKASKISLTPTNKGNVECKMNAVETKIEGAKCTPTKKLQDTIVQNEISTKAAEIGNKTKSPVTECKTASTNKLESKSDVKKAPDSDSQLNLDKLVSTKLEDDGFESDNDKENIPEHSKKRKEPTAVPFLITPTQKKFKTIAGKSPAFAQFGTVLSQLELPDSYQKLIILFNQFDNTLVYLKQKNQICVFHNVRRIVEVNANRGFTVEEFRKILTIEPELFTMRPYHIVNQDVDTFTIDFKETENIFDLFKLIPSRRLEFEKKLVEKAKQHHQVLINLQEIPQRQ